MNTMQQNSEWLKQRIGKITGSRVGGMLNLSPFANRNDVMREMVREHFHCKAEFVGNVATEYGNEHENKAIAEYEELFDALVISTGFHTHPDHNWLGASPDGFVGGDGLIEVKCPFGLRNDPNPVFKSIEEQPHYYAQIQLQLHVTGKAKCDYFAWSKHGRYMEQVERDGKWLENNWEALLHFIEEYKTIIADEDLAKPFIEELEINRSDAEWVTAESRYLALQEQSKRIEQELKQERDRLIQLADGKKVRGTQILVFPVQKQGSISYSKAVKDLLPGADLEPYRSRPSTTYSIRSIEA